MRKERPTILIATTNEGKLKEIQYKLQTQDINWITLHDITPRIEEPEESGNSAIENALIKATYYATHTGYITIADDTGLFVPELDGWPGIHVGRFLKTDDTKFSKFLKKMEKTIDRRATFTCAIAVYDPGKKTSFVSEGALDGSILTQSVENTNTQSWGYNRLFFVPEKQKTYSELSLAEKSEISHRGKALHQIKYYLANQYGAKQLIIPIALIIHEGKILMNLRNDPNNIHAHNKWEFPGGGINFGENTRDALLREVKEETGFNVEVVELLQHIQTEEWTRDQGKIYYQLHILPYVCRIIGGQPQTNDEEVLDSKWFDIEDVQKYDLMGRNDVLWENIRPLLEQVIKQHN